MSGSNDYESQNRITPMDDHLPASSVTHAGRRRFLTGLGSLTGAAALFWHPMARAQSDAWKQPSNNNELLDLQHEELPSQKVGTVKLDYFGHCAFRITSPEGVTLMVDPWRDDPSGAWGLWFKQEFPEVVVDITMSTHTHFDHDAIFRPQSTMVLDRMLGDYSFADLRIIGVADKHACLSPGWYNWTNAIEEFGQDPCPPDNPGHMDMAVYVVETGGIRIAFWGDNRHNPPESFWQALGRVDVLTIPVDGSWHILSASQIAAVVERLKPRAVIPTHYLNESTTYTLSTLQPCRDWVEEQSSYRHLDGPELELNKDELDGMKTEVLHFGDHALLPS